MFLGFWIVAKRGTWETLKSDDILGIMAMVLLAALFLKYLRELVFSGDYHPNLLIVLGALVSIAIAAIC